MKVPSEMEFALEAVKDNDEEVKRIGVELGVRMCQKLLEAGAPGLHLYTLNLEKAAVSILEKLGLVEGRVSCIHVCEIYLTNESVLFAMR